jgi:hypothetical protein
LEVWEIALFLVRFYQLGIKRVHLLGTYSFITIALGAYMARHMFDWVSLDATSWRFAADHAEYFNLCDLSRVSLITGAKIRAEIKNDCPCQFCKGQSFNQIKNVLFKKRVALLRGHNWYAADKAFHDLYKHSAGIIQLERFLKTRSKRQAKVDELINALSVVDIMKDFDIRLIQELLDPAPKKRKPTRTSRQLTAADQKIAETVPVHLGGDPS